jgi:hypothetical protein
MKLRIFLAVPPAAETIASSQPAPAPVRRRLDDLRSRIAISHAYMVCTGAATFHVNIIRSGGTRRFQLTHADPPQTKRSK